MPQTVKIMHSLFSGIKATSIVSLFSFMFSIASYATQNSQQSSIEVLKKNLGDTFNIKDTGEETQLCYCPDNTCLVFSSKSTHRNELGDFAVLYLSNISSYVYLFTNMHGHGVFVDNLSEYSKELLNTHKGNCSGDNYTMIGCILLELQKKYSVKVISSRYDEEVYTTITVNLADKVRPSALESRQKMAEKLKQ